MIREYKYIITLQNHIIIILLPYLICVGIESRQLLLLTKLYNNQHLQFIKFACKICCSTKFIIVI